MKFVIFNHVDKGAIDLNGFYAYHLADITRRPLEGGILRSNYYETLIFIF